MSCLHLSIPSWSRKATCFAPAGSLYTPKRNGANYRAHMPGDPHHGLHTMACHALSAPLEHSTNAPIPRKDSCIIAAATIQFRR